MLLFLYALLAGVVTIAGPCILPLLPIILGTSTVRAHPSRPLFIVLGFTLSFAVFATVFGIFGSFLGISPETFRLLAAACIGFFGLMMIVPKLQEAIFAKVGPVLTSFGPKAKAGDEGLWSGFVLGTSLGLVWSPCAGPVLGSILTLVASKQDIAQAAALLLAYALGAGLPMLAIAYGGQAATLRIRGLAKYTGIVQRIFGIVILLVAVGLATGVDRDVQTWLLTNAPWLFPNLKLNL